jgi:hypothetical protein
MFCLNITIAIARLISLFCPSFRSELESYLTLQESFSTCYNHHPALFLLQPPSCSVLVTTTILLCFYNHHPVLFLTIQQASQADNKVAAKSRTQVDDQVELRR